MNIQRAVESCIDLAMHIVAEQKLGIPQNSGDAFEILYDNKIIMKDMNEKLKAMIGFRNIAVHDYQAVNINIVQNIIEEHLADIEEFAALMLKRMND